MSHMARTGFDMKKKKLTKKQVKAYEKLSGIQTTGEVYSLTTSNEVMDLLEGLYLKK